MGETAIRSSIVGFLIPEFTDEATGMAALTRENFEKVRAGYACAKCLAEFRHYMARCPACGLERDLAADIRQTPEIWQQHFDERNAPRRPRQVATAREGLEHLAVSPDVERIPLSKLKNTRKR